MTPAALRKDPALRTVGYECLFAGLCLALVGLSNTLVFTARGTGLSAGLRFACLFSLALAGLRWQLDRRMTKMWGPPRSKPRWSLMTWGLMVGPWLGYLALWQGLTDSAAFGTAAALACALFASGIAASLLEFVIGGLLCAALLWLPSPLGLGAGSGIFVCVGLTLAACGLGVNWRLVWPREDPL